MQKLTVIFTFLITLALSAVIVIFFDNAKAETISTPKELYQVYLSGEKIGVIKSKDKLEAYIDKKQQEIKAKYNVNTVYPPKNLNIQKYVSYDDKVLTEEEAYKKIKEKSPFTVKGWTFKISKDDGSSISINVLDKKVFTEAAMKTVEHFVPEDEYEPYKNGTQSEIKDTGKMIENLYIPNLYKNKKETYISTDEQVFTDVNELTKYLLFSTTQEQQKYIVKDGDTIDKIAFDHQLGTDEFLVANPQFSNANSLLFPGQEVSIGLIKPLFNVVLEEHVVEDQNIPYDTETTTDATLAYGTTVVKQVGSNGIQRVTEKRQTTNGVITGLEIDRSATKTIKEPVKQIVVKGTKSNSGGTVFVNPDGKWVWPTNTPYVITTYFGYRWGEMHAAVDISGTGYGSPIRAARSGVVFKSGVDRTKGNYLILQHDNNYYTNYLHLSKKYVTEGQTVTAGQVIAAMGNSGFVVGTTGTHLHFGVFIGEPYKSTTKPINPLSVFR